MAQEAHRYNEIDPAIEARVDELLGKMTLEEKVGQLVQVQINHAIAILPDFEERVSTGRISSIFGISDVRKINYYQKLAVEGSRLGIPLLVGNDVIHGFRTIFPIPLA